MKLRAENLIKQYKSRKVVNHVSVEVNQGEIVGLLGPNGAGKTTTFYMIVGLIKPNEGSIHLDNEDITKLPMYRRAQKGIGYLAQEASVFRKLTVEDNIMAILEMTRLSKKEQRNKMESLLEEFGLRHVRKNKGDVLSGGERRRTEIARALAVSPKFILLDEPFAGVDPIAVEDIQTIVRSLKDKNIGILITDHNVHETLTITDRAYLLFEGSILKAGTAEELASDEKVRKVYLGQNFELRTNKAGQENDLRNVLSTYEEHELAYMYHYLYPSYSQISRDTIDSFLEEKSLTPEILDDIREALERRHLKYGDDQCPRCGSYKLSVQQEELWNTTRAGGYDGLIGKSETVEKITCQVCGFVISDPNENKLR